MTLHRTLSPAALCAAALLATTTFSALAVDAAAALGKPPTSPDQPKPRTGAYEIITRGTTVTYVKCAEGGNVFVPTHENATDKQRDHDIRESCKTIDYTK